MPQTAMTMSMTPIAAKTAHQKNCQHPLAMSLMPASMSQMMPGASAHRMASHDLFTGHRKSRF